VRGMGSLKERRFSMIVESAGLGIQSGRLPGQDAAGQVGVVRIALLLRGERSGDRAPSGPAGVDDWRPCGSGIAARIEARQRAPPRPRIALERDLVLSRTSTTTCGSLPPRGRHPRVSDCEHGNLPTHRHAVLLTRDLRPSRACRGHRQARRAYSACVTRLEKMTDYSNFLRCACDVHVLWTRTRARGPAGQSDRSLAPTSTAVSLIVHRLLKRSA